MAKDKTKQQNKKAKQGKPSESESSTRQPSPRPAGRLLSATWRLLKTRRGKIIAVILVVLAPLGVIARTSVVTSLRPIVTKVVDGVSGGLGADPIVVTNRHEYTGLTYAVTAQIAANDPSPTKGCFDEQWIKANGGVPLFTEIYVSISTPRSDVALVGASIKYDTDPSPAKAVVTCDEGGDGAMTVFDFKLYKSKNLERSVSGQGASEDGKNIFLPMVAGEEYPVAVMVQVGEPVVAKWTAELLFQVGDKQVKHSLQATRTTGVSKAVPVFTSQEGRWIASG
ncbi:hypothetical protein [Kribbella sp. NPDC048928]|uniref:hypothetical protein n=1 Tax=Kribbella sp. NPDC048928 TaxID=3364111 RepID=UPI0037221469